MHDNMFRLRAMTASFFGAMRTKRCFSIPFLSLAVAVFIVLFDNQLFWQNLAARFGSGSFEHWKLGLTLGTILVLLLNMVFSLTSFRIVFKPFLVSVLLIAAGVSYFSDSYGVVIDKSMIHNILETNIREANELMTWPLLWHMLLYGGLPSALVVLAPIHYPTFGQGLLLRAGNIVVSFVMVLALFMSDFKGLVLFGREHRDLKVFINPSYPLYSLNKVIRAKFLVQAAEPLQVIAADAVREQNGRRSVVVLVVGETARASEMAFNGYGRNTNPYTDSRDVINFSNVESCGTATAVSVPCMFSPWGRDQFNADKAGRSENLLDVLQRTGVKVVWRDNDSGSKGVATRVIYENFSKKNDARFCSEGNCFDEVLLDGLDDLLRENQGDMLVVLHVMGSHGPSYYKRSPSDLKLFTPECTQDNVQDCPQQSIVNAYDNTIVYTDYILAKVIDLLQEQKASTAMLYVSDHGESLGENGIYLHGLPYVLAPKEQTHVPMQFWASEKFFEDHHLDKAMLLANRGKQYSQDNLFHSMLGLFHVRTNLYREDLDLFASKSLISG